MFDTEYCAQGSMFYPDLPNKNICSDGCLLELSNMVSYRALSLFLSRFLRKGAMKSNESLIPSNNLGKQLRFPS